MDIVYILLRAALVVALIIVLTRLNGLRSFSKMSGFDFAITVAKGSVLASAVMAGQPSAFWGNMGALVALFVVQRAISTARTRLGWFHRTVDNSPLLLMRDGEIIEENLRRGRVSRSDLMGKLREANALRLQDVRAVILEDTGDVSVLHGDTQVDDCLLDGVTT
ncbi:DUF421 domain-containing protein [Maribius pontilimi]|uniref:DUF421 domain-containing protein n=1 Tax=Palleronia pontilimi TaxID=1964209 RepID=A0A934MFH5_9RHOB|nr:YetF domain-containing protein [Palleronia pontilimi]MBJ3761464.1 DUF421 domain-containing protein [Palleronia pontilimi]